MAAHRAFDIVYQDGDDGPLLARLYLPITPAPIAAIVEVHGGAWMSNSRVSNAVVHEALVAAGIVVMAIDFRMAPAHRYPASIADVNFAIRWLKHHAPAFGVAPERVGLLGTSSGGHQALLAALRVSDPRYAAIALPQDAAIDAKVPFMVAGWPVADPLARYRMAQQKANQNLINAHHAFWPDEAAMEEGSPQLLLERGDAAHLPHLLVLQGTNDDNLPPGSADRFAAAYKARGGVVSVEHYPDQPHTFIVRDPNSDASRKALARMIAFIRAEVGA